MNIGIDGRLLGKKNGGIGRYTLELAKNILAIDKENRYSLIYNRKDADMADLQSLYQFKNLKLIPTAARHYSIAEQTSFLRLLNKQNFDLVHFPNFNVPLWYEKPFVVTIHDAVHHKIGGAKKSHFLHFLAYKKVIANAAKKSKKIITVSDYSKSDIVKIFEVPPEKVVRIYEGTSLATEVDSATVEKIKKKYLLHNPYFLFVGVLERKKNLVSLTRGFDQFIIKYGLEMDLVVVGKADSHYPEIKHHALDIKNNNRLVFTGYVEDADLSALYRGSYAFASSSLHEGFGLPGVEAMKFGLPLMVSNIEVFNEIYDNAAVYFNPLDPDDIAEKMFLLAHDQQFHRQLAINSLKRSEFFDWKTTAEETLKVYKEALVNI